MQGSPKVGLTLGAILVVSATATAWLSGERAIGADGPAAKSHEKADDLFFDRISPF